MSLLADQTRDEVDAADGCRSEEPTLGVGADDADCDGVPATEDCDDFDEALGSSANDADCDGVPATEDCDDFDEALGYSADDADCDGVPATEDCDDFDEALGSFVYDPSCGGLATGDACGGLDSTVSAADDADCDGVLTANDCDDQDPTILDFDPMNDCYKFMTNYVDASLANTDIASGGHDSVWASGNDGTTGGTVADGDVVEDGKWRFRSALGGDGIWEATSGSSQLENCVELVSHVSGLGNGAYHVFVFFYAVAPDGAYPIRAGLSSDPDKNQLFSRSPTLGIQAGADATRDLQFVTPPKLDPTRTIRYGYVGKTTVTDGILSVYIDDYPATRIEERTWYAGFGYAEAK